jgi:hypothetical protein
MKNFLFYLGHILLLAFIISLQFGQIGINFILLPVAIVTYFIAFIQRKIKFKYQDEEEIPKLYERPPLRTKIAQIESPYIFVMKNKSTGIKTISLQPNKEGDTDTDLEKEGLELESGFARVNIKALLLQMKNKPRDYCKIEIFTSIQQCGMPVTYTNTLPDGSSKSGPLPDAFYTEMCTIIPCDINIKKGNSLDFSILPGAMMVVKLYPYRKVSND